MYSYWQRLQVHHVHYGVQYGPGIFWHCESFADIRRLMGFSTPHPGEFLFVFMSFISMRLGHLFDLLSNMTDSVTMSGFHNG